MREIKSGDIILRIRGTSLVPFYYRKEFDKDLINEVEKILNKRKNLAFEALKMLEDLGADTKDIKKLKTKKEKENLAKKLQQNISSIQKSSMLLESMNSSGVEKPILEILEFAWVMHKAQLLSEERKEDVITFEEWLIKYQDIKIMDIQEDVMEELQAGIFRKTNS